MYPSENECKAFLQEGKFKRIPLCHEIMADEFTTVQLLRILSEKSRHSFILESAENNKPWSRYSFLGFDPTMEITCIDGEMVVKTGEKILLSEKGKKPKEIIRKIMADYTSPKLKDLPPFTGGLVGYFSYEYMKYEEPKLNLAHKENGDFKDLDLMLFNDLIVFDHYKQKILLITGISLEDYPSSYEQGKEKLLSLEKLLKEGKKKSFAPLHITKPLSPEKSKKEYETMVEKAKHHIHEGDIFQVVLSNPLLGEAEGNLFDLYRTLRVTNPSPYMFYFQSDAIEIAGSSPETLVKLEDGTLYTYPLAGTRKRGATQEEDEKLKKELLADEKELSEHNMLVDLGRNDIGKISEIGSVKVSRYQDVLFFSHVMHIGSTVEGTISAEKDALDAIDAILPAGTLSGAPKIRACEIIHQLEGRKRGIYGGAVGYLDFSGNMDTAIGIRLCYKKGKTLCVQSGAGIVADSIPENEYNECLNKAKALTEALSKAEGGNL